MILELKIQDFAVVRSLELELGPGLNVLTGETGAGKSIVIDAVSAIRGGRVSSNDVRQGADHAVVEAALDISTTPRAAKVLEEMGHTSDETLILVREIATEGRNKCRVNARLANVTHLAQIGEALIDIHGQHDHQSLLIPARHVDLLDALGGESVAVLADEVESLVHERNALIREERELDENDRDRAQREDLLRYQIDEIDAAALESDEDEHLAAERRRLGHAERIAQAVNVAYEALYGGHGSEQLSANDALGTAKAHLEDAASYDDQLSEPLETIEEVLSAVGDVALEVRRYADRLEADPGRLAEVEERLELIARLKRKYGDTLQEMVNFRNEAERELMSLTSSQERRAAIRARREELERKLVDRVERLSDLRRQTGEHVGEAISERLAKLQMPDARLNVALHRKHDEDGLMIGGERVHVGARGIDHVEFLFSANPGEEVRPLARIASGGEMSRVMLAIKGALAEIDPVSTLIFDEVDAGLGGRAAESVADALAELARTHQVLVVTHLAQVAARADQHFTVTKSVREGTTVVSAERLEGEARVRELARMLDGKETQTGFEHARALLRLAHKGKAAS